MFPNSEYTDQNFSGVDMGGDALRGKRFDTCTFTKCRFNSTAFDDCHFVDCRFIHCDLSLATVKNCSFSGASFKDSKLVGINWTDANWQSRSLFKPLAFDHCTLNYSTFIGMNLRKATLTHCIAHDVDFSEVDLKGANCRDTDFADSRFHRTDLTEADFVRAKNYAIDAVTNKLKKTRFALPDAIALLRSLDIVLVDEDEAQG